MAARWVGLVCPNNKKIVRTKRGLGQSLHALGATSVLVMAAAVNFALYPEALAAVVGGEHEVVGFVPEQPSAGAVADAAPSIVLNENEVRLLAATVWGEARSEGEDGMRAVAHVMLNRVGNRFGQNIETVIMTPYQFSVWNRGDPNRRLVSNPEAYATGGTALETWEAAQRIAREVLSGQSVDPTGGALFYHTRAIRPSWSRQGIGRQVIGAHVFYADVPDRGIRRTPATLSRVTQVSNTFAQPMPIDGPAASASQQGPRAGRVNGVIQHAPTSMARQDLPSETIDVNAAATPTINGVPIGQQTSLR